MHQRTRIKICGITRAGDARAAVALGADALGFVFWARSARALTPASAAPIIAALPPFVAAVGLFVDAGPDEVRAALAAGCDLLQFHGEEDPDFCASFGRPWLKAVRVDAGTDLHGLARRYAGARGLLLDARVEGVPGGTGQTFDWQLVPRDLSLPVVLAGGLDAGNVAQAIRTLRPWAVDVSGGVESAKGIKDAAKIAAFIEGVRRVDQQD
jgi:phosphoribosylanthranilate isomerase